MQATGGDDLLATARLSFDQHRERQIGILSKLHPQFFNGRTAADQRRCAVRLVVPFVERAKRQRSLEDLLQIGRIARLGDEICGTEGARMTRVALVALPGEDDDADIRGGLEQVGNQRQPLVGTMRDRRQAEVDQRQRWRSSQLSQQLHAMRTRVTGNHFKERTHRKTQGVTDQCVIIDDEQQRSFWQGGFRTSGHQALAPPKE
jgi:hypothetical protein